MIVIATRAFIAHLEAEIDWLKREVKHERQRAEQAIDRLLYQRGIAPVTPPEPRAMTPEEEALAKDIAALTRNPEFATAGSTEEA